MSSRQNRFHPGLHDISGSHVILGKDAARLYGVSPLSIQKAVEQNSKFFPAGFVIPPSREERFLAALIFDRESVPKDFWDFPYAFTAKGITMLAYVLKGRMAAKVRTYLIRTYMILTRNVFARKIKSGADWPDPDLKKQDPEAFRIFDSIFKLLKERPGNIGSRSLPKAGKKRASRRTR